MAISGRLQKWVDYCCDHPTGGPEWYWAQDAPVWPGRADEVPLLIAGAFEKSGELLARFSDEQLDQAFWFLIGNAPPQFVLKLSDPAIEEAARTRAVRSFVPLFEQVMQPRCSPKLGHLDEPGASALNCSCYMWWDMMPLGPLPSDPSRKNLDSAALGTMQAILQIPHDACRESAIHGLAHWYEAYPDKVGEILDEFISTTPELRPNLLTYAQRARRGSIL